MAGRLEVVCGPMFAGKSTALIGRYRAAVADGRDVHVMRALFDVRYRSGHVVSHADDSVPSHVLAHRGDLPHGKSLVLIDEIQFLSSPWFVGDPVAGIRSLLDDGTDVVGFGLDMDSNGDPFPATGAFIGMADSVVRLKASCVVCRGEATHTFKKRSDGPVWELGGADLYEARCEEHWHR